jgi:hypothetical protein
MDTNQTVGMRPTDGTTPRGVTKRPWIISAILLILIALAALTLVSTSQPLQSLTSDHALEAR